MQLVSMVSTIANGGVYLPPHVLMAGQPMRMDKRLLQRSPTVSEPGRDCLIRCRRVRTVFCQS